MILYSRCFGLGFEISRRFSMLWWKTDASLQNWCKPASNFCWTMVSRWSSRWTWTTLLPRPFSFAQALGGSDILVWEFFGNNVKSNLVWLPLQQRQHGITLQTLGPKDSIETECGISWTFARCMVYHSQHLLDRKRLTRSTKQKPCQKESSCLERMVWKLVRLAKSIMRVLLLGAFPCEAMSLACWSLLLLCDAIWCDEGWWIQAYHGERKR